MGSRVVSLLALLWVVLVLVDSIQAVGDPFTIQSTFPASKVAKRNNRYCASTGKAKALINADEVRQKTSFTGSAGSSKVILNNET